MKITIGQKASETHDTFLLEPGPEKWHGCTYPGRPGTLRIRPGEKCEDGCDAKPLPHGTITIENGSTIATDLPGFNFPGLPTVSMEPASTEAPSNPDHAAGVEVAPADPDGLEPLPAPVKPRSRFKSEK